MAEKKKKKRTQNPIDTETKNLRKLYNRKITLVGRVKKLKAQIEPTEKELAKVLTEIDALENPVSHEMPETSGNANASES